MGVCILNMKMPDSCDKCRFGFEGMCFALHKTNVDEMWDGTRPDLCPLVEVPAHGQLIDANSDIQVVVTMRSGGKCSVDLIAPTVIPAEER